MRCDFSLLLSYRSCHLWPMTAFYWSLATLIFFNILLPMALNWFCDTDSNIFSLGDILNFGIPNIPTSVSSLWLNWPKSIFQLVYMSFILNLVIIFFPCFINYLSESNFIIFIDFRLHTFIFIYLLLYCVVILLRFTDLVITLFILLFISMGSLIVMRDSPSAMW